MPCQGPWGRQDYPTYHEQWMQTERELCEARWLLLQLTERTGIPADLAARLAAHRAAHLAHRTGDRDHVLDAIRSTLGRLDSDEREIRRYGGEPTAAFHAQRAKLLESLDRIAARTDEDLLATYWGNEERLSADVVDHT